VTSLAGRTVGLVGALSALPRRLAARAVEAQGGQLVHGVTRRTALVVFGRGLLRGGDGEVERRVDAARAAGRTLRSENGFLRIVTGVEEVPAGSGRREVLAQSGLGERDFELLALFDGFERDVEPFSFRDLILARKYAGLLAGGAGWGAIVRSVHRSGPVASLTAKALQVGARQAIHVRHDEGLSELDGQMLLGLGGEAEDADELFGRAEAAEAAGRHGEAAELYARCLAGDPGDAVAAFNRANCLTAADRGAEAEAELARALRLDPGFVEAWFNLACAVAGRGRADAARGFLNRAITLDPDYADAVFNLAKLEFDAGDLPAARRWWVRYLELDADSAWARKAARGIRFVDLQLARDAG